MSSAMECDSGYPGWLHDAVYDDGLFADAYEAVPAPRRALLKTCIARLYDFYGPSQSFGHETRREWEQGFSSIERVVPRRRCAILMDGSVGPASLLAALMPAKAAGVGSIAVVFTGEGGPGQSVLVALELAGQELVLPAGDRLPELIDLHKGPDGCVVCLGQTDTFIAGHKGPIWHGPQRKKIGILQATEDLFDLDAIGFVHPDAEIVVKDALSSLDHYQAVFASTELAAEVQGQSCLFLGPGHEGCWLYPGLSRSFFQSRKISLI